MTQVRIALSTLNTKVHTKFGRRNQIYNSPSGIGIGDGRSETKVGGDSYCARMLLPPLVYCSPIDKRVLYDDIVLTKPYLPTCLLSSSSYHTSIIRHFAEEQRIA